MWIEQRRHRRWIGRLVRVVLWLCGFWKITECEAQQKGEDQEDHGMHVRPASATTAGPRTAASHRLPPASAITVSPRGPQTKLHRLGFGRGIEKLHKLRLTPAPVTKMKIIGVAPIVGFSSQTLVFGSQILHLYNIIHFHQFIIIISVFGDNHIAHPEPKFQHNTYCSIVQD
jgi:hypothetical protein